MQDIMTSLDNLEQSLNETKDALAAKGVERETLKAVDIPQAVSEINVSDDTFSVFSSSEVREALEEGYGAV